MLNHLDQVEAVPCTPEFWGALGLHQSDRFTLRQNQACRHGYDRVENGWVFNVDADEFLYTQDKPIGKMLAEQDQDTRTLQVAVAEDVGLPTSVTGRAFRMKMPRSTVQEVFGARSGLVIRNHGMVGHSAGKSLLRAGMSGFKMRQHAIYRRGKAVVDKILGAEDGYCVLHFHNPGYDEWRRKLD